MKSILTKYTSQLTPSHGLLLETKQHLAAALGRVEDCKDELYNILVIGRVSPIPFSRGLGVKVILQSLISQSFLLIFGFHQGFI